MENFAAATMAGLRRNLRDYYGKRNYRITADGEVHYYGNPADVYDRTHDYWHYLGRVECVDNDITRERGTVWRIV
jgi:hypothetical protein